MAKWWCTAPQFRVADTCLPLFGGYGYIEEDPIARLWADARVQRICGGTTEIRCLSLRPRIAASVRRAEY